MYTECKEYRDDTSPALRELMLWKGKTLTRNIQGVASVGRHQATAFVT